MNINYQGVAVISQDHHIPFQDQRTIREVELFMGDLQPDLIIHPGDVSDFYQLSKFDKDPNRGRGGTIQTECNMVSAMFKRERDICPNARIIVEPGNHWDRLRRYLWSSAPALSDLECLQLENLMRLKENEVELIDADEGVLINGNFLVTHAEMIRAHSSWTAKGMSDKHGGSGIHGHTHRLGSYYKTNRSGMYAWWENGCLCSLNPDWIIHPNWQQGFSVVTFFKGGRFWVEPIPIINRKFIYGGKLYGSGGKKRVD